MTAPTPADLTALLYGARGQTVDSTQGAEVLSIVRQAAFAYTRGQGFSDGTANAPNADIASVIKTAAARLISHPRQLPLDQTEGQESVSFHGGFNGFSIGELFTLNRYRARAQ